MTKKIIPEVAGKKHVEAIDILASKEYDTDLTIYLEQMRNQRKAFILSIKSGIPKRNCFDTLLEDGYMSDNDKLINEYLNVLGKSSKLSNAMRESINAICTTVFHSTVKRLAKMNAKGKVQIKKPRKKKADVAKDDISISSGEQKS